MSKFLHADDNCENDDDDAAADDDNADAKAIAIPRIFSENSRAKNEKLSHAVNEGGGALRIFKNLLFVSSCAVGAG